MRDRPLKYRDMLKSVRRFGVNEDRSRGKGSHRMLIGVVAGTIRKFPVPCHNEGAVLAAAFIRAIRRRFELTPEKGVSDEQFYC